MSTPPDEFEQVAALLSAGALAELLDRSGVVVEAASATYVRIKPGGGALIALDLVHRDADGAPLTTPGYIRLHDAKRAVEVARKWHAGRATATPLGDGVRLLSDGRSVLFVFPNDAEVRGLRFVAEPDKLKRLLAGLPAIGGAGFRVRGRASSFERVRYKPERRLILRARLALRNDATGEDSMRNVFVRFFSDARGEALHRLMVSLRAGRLGSAVPEPLGAVADGRMFVEAEVTGQELFLRAGSGGDAAAVADVLARLHSSAADGLPLLLPQDVLTNAVEAVGTLGRVAPTLASPLADLEARLRAHLPAPAPQAATLHGDCHLHQFLVDPGRIVIVDFERAGLGDPAYDLGHMRAHALSSARLAAVRGEPARHAEFVDRVVAGYRAARPGESLAALPFYTACGLLDRALLPFRHLEPDWLLQTGFLVEAALAQLGATSRTRGPHRTPRFFASTTASNGDSVFYPSSATTWSGFVLDRTGRRSYGSYDAVTDTFTPRTPEADPALPGLAVYVRRGDLVAYRVGRRATVRTPAPEVTFVKLLPPAKANGVARRWRLARRAAAASLGFPVIPELIRCEPELGALTMTPLSGVSVRDVLASEREVPPTALARLAEALAAFHRSAIADEPGAAGEPRSLAQWQEIVAPHDPGLADTCARARAVIEGVSEPAAAGGLVHGDLHDGNVFLDGERVGLLDLDGVRRGDPVEDVGNLAAHFILRAMQHGHDLRAGDALAHAWIGKYARCAPVPLANACAATARTLIRLACVYRFRSRWLALVPRLVRAAFAWGEAAQTEAAR